MKAKSLGTALLLCAVALAATGCVLLVGAGAGAGAYAYVEGNLKTTYDVALPQAWESTRLALDQVGMKPDVDQHDAFSGVLKGTMADGREFYVAVRKVDDTRTEVGIRIGLGDRKTAQSIHERIAANLKS
jgi:hypothetical protein